MGNSSAPKEESLICIENQGPRESVDDKVMEDPIENLSLNHKIALEMPVPHSPGLWWDAPCTTKTHTWYNQTSYLIKFEFVLPYGHWDLATQQDNTNEKNMYTSV